MISQHFIFKNIKFFSFYLFSAVFFAAMQLIEIKWAFGRGNLVNIAAAQGVLDGFPYWRIYQSRVLGPLLVELVKNFTGLRFEMAYTLTVYFLLTIFFFILIFFSRKLWRSKFVALGIALLALFFNTIFMQKPWLYIWDIVDLIVFTLLLWGIISSKTVLFIVSILAIEIFNREIVFVLWGWFLIDAVFDIRLIKVRWPKVIQTFRAQQFFVALILLGVSYGVIESLRNTLLVKEIGPILWHIHTGRFFSFQLLVNFHYIMFNLTHPFRMYSFIATIFILTMPIWILMAIMYKNVGVIRSSFLYLILWICTMVFGFFNENRIWIMIVPYLALVLPIVFAKHELKAT